jgi:hypothetical protein
MVPIWAETWAQHGPNGPEFVLSDEFLDVSLSVLVDSPTFKRVVELKNWLPLKLVPLA